MTATLSATRFELAQPKYRRQIWKFAHQNAHKLECMDPADLHNEILEVLWLACMKYDPDNGACFNTFFWTCAKRRFLDLHKYASRQCRAGNYNRVWLDDSRFADLLDEFLEGSAEDEALARMTVLEIYRSRTAVV